MLVKKTLFLFGMFLTIAALYRLFPLLGEYGKLAEYGRGYVWGNLIILGVGGAIMVLTLIRIKSKDKKTQ